jgi:hypothetical protein
MLASLSCWHGRDAFYGTALMWAQLMPQALHACFGYFVGMVEVPFVGRHYCGRCYCRKHCMLASLSLLAWSRCLLWDSIIVGAATAASTACLLRFLCGHGRDAFCGTALLWALLLSQALHACFAFFVGMVEMTFMGRR